MSRKQNKKNAQAPTATLPAGNGAPLWAEAERIRELIDGRHSKTALQLAKDIHKRCGTAESEALLVDAYKARIEDLLKLGMTVEAKALLGILRERFPAALPRLAELDREICVVDGRLEEVVGPLRDANLPAEDRDRIEAFIRQRICDLPALATVSSLPQEHPLRVAAMALAAAFQAVTQGPVEDKILALPQVSRRGPLASWKALVRAIASYYRREDEECRKWLRAIAGDSAPARLLPAFDAMLGMKAGFTFSIAEKKLIAGSGDRVAALRPALSALEDALRTRKQRPILDAIRVAMTASDSGDSEMRERLRQHIAVRSLMQHIPLPAINAALGRPPQQNAYYYRLLARTLEDQQYVEGYAEAVIVWADFRREAIKENWFAAGGLEDGVLSLHMAQTIAKLPAELVEEMKDRQPFHRKSGKWDKEEGLPSAGMLFERACVADPHPESFQMWLHWARKLDSWQVADNVAEQWRKARAEDIQPLLYLMESTEKRNAFKKSLKYLEEAENLDRLNPEVRRAKLRLLLSAVLRHLRQRKTHLAQAGIEQLETVPEVRPGEIAALAAALRWCSGAIDGDKAVLLERETELSKSVGTVAAHLLMMALLQEAELRAAATLPPLKVSKTPALELLTGAVKACVLGEGVGLRIQLPLGWNNLLIAALYLPNCPLDAAQMLVLGEAALESLSAELAYNVSSVGLAKGKANARFLFLRARSLPQWALYRRDGCFTSALELARQERNTELAGKILDHLNGTQSSKSGRRRRRWRFGFSERDGSMIASHPVSPELLSKILEEEQELEQFPVYEGYREPKYAEDFDSSLCDCPKCRAKRGEPVEDSDLLDDEDEDDFEDEFDDDEDEFDGPEPSFSQIARNMLEGILHDLPPEVAQKIKAALAAGEDPITAFERILKKELPSANLSTPSKIEKKAKTAKLTPPEQGSLF